MCFLIDAQTIVGYAFFPIYAGGRIAVDGLYSLPVCANLAANYLSSSKTDVKWMDSKKPLFSFRLRWDTTIFSQDPSLTQFFKQYQYRLEGSALYDEVGH